MPLLFLLDENVPVEVASAINARGHGVAFSRDMASKKATDQVVADLAGKLGAIVVTWDRVDYQRLLRLHPDDGKKKPLDRFSLIAFRCDYAEGASRMTDALPFIEFAHAGVPQSDPRVRVLIERDRVCVYQKQSSGS